jgi:hypothetical protein
VNVEDVTLPVSVIENTGRDVLPKAQLNAGLALNVTVMI